MPRLNSSREFEAAVPHSWPWVAALCGSNFTCYAAGTVVGPRWVLAMLKVIRADITPEMTRTVRTGVYNWLSPQQVYASLFRC